MSTVEFGSGPATDPTVVAVRPGSPAESAGVRAGDLIVRVNGRVPRDIIEWTMMLDEADPAIDVRRGQEILEIDVAKRAGEPFGADLDSAVFDRVRTCDNHCPFCFIYQLPPGLRRSLYLKDDDYRLSFLYGNFTTLTRFTESDLERVITERLSPLHVSIHCTDPDLRTEMLRNRRGAMSLRWLRVLLDHGIDVRGQIVVCPGVNDDLVLDETLAGILDRFPEISMLAVVPLGISSYNAEETMRAHTTAEAARVVDIVERWQTVYEEVLGRPVVYAADEYYLLADRPFPESTRYGDFELHEDGIGMARAFELEFTGATDRIIGPQSGFFAAVDLPDNPASYTALRRCGTATETAVSLTRRDRSSPICILTGELGARVIGPLVAGLDRADVRVLAVRNEFFGGTTGVTGLLTGTDLRRALDGQPVDHRYLLPDVCLSDDGRFLDGLRLDDLGHRVEVVATNGRALREAIGSGHGGGDV